MPDSAGFIEIRAPTDVFDVKTHQKKTSPWHSFLKSTIKAQDSIHFK